VRLPTLLAVTLLSLFTFSAVARAQAPTLDLSPSPAAGARTAYTVQFTPTAALTGPAARIDVQFPEGTGFDAFSGGSVRVDGQTVGSCQAPVALRSACSLDTGRTIAAGARVTVVFRGIVNRAAAGPVTATVTSSAEPAPLTAHATVAPRQAVASATATISRPSAATGALTNYVVEVRLSSTGGLSGEADSRIEFTLPPGTTFSDFGSTVRRGGDTLGACNSPAGTTVTCWLSAGQSAAGGDVLQVRLRGVVNGPAGPGRRIGVTTTSDTLSADSAPFEIVPAGTVTNVVADNTSPSAATGARTNYTVDFTLSGTGGLEGEAGSEVTLTLPDGTGHSGFGSTVMRGAETLGACDTPSTTTVTCWLSFSASAAANDRLRVTLRGVVNPPATAADTKVTVRTTSDHTAAVASAPLPLPGAQSVASVTATNATPSAAAGARTVYDVAFTPSSTGGLSGEAGSEITLTLPTGTTYAGFGSTITSDGETVGACTTPTTRTVTCWLSFSADVDPGRPVQIRLRGVVNPPATAADTTVTVRTTSDHTAAVASAPLEVVAGHSVGPVTVTAPPGPSASGPYVIRFTASATGGLSGQAGSEIRLRFPSGTTFGPGGGTVRQGGETVGGCSSPSGMGVTCWLSFSSATPAGGQLQITFPSIGNPPSPGPYRLALATTSDTPDVSSAPYNETGAAAPPETTIASSTAPPFTFSTDTGVRFECRLDGGTFSACASPFAPALAPGTYRLEVVAIDATGAADPTPAVREFTVVATVTPEPTVQPTPTATPAPTAAPTPSPTPTAQAVVAAPAKGTITVKRPGANAYVELDAAAGIPLGSTVDAKQGAVRITTPRGAAEFSEGIFRLTQVGGITVLTLTEPLAPCAKGRASAARRKAKSRKLWGKGKGAFRTAGKYSAATVRGTTWLVQDSCAGTLTRVTQGAVTVRDQVRGKTVVVRAGKRYLATPRR
jgi:hypothetical protein